jgi:hypothetical protein
VLHTRRSLTPKLSDRTTDMSQPKTQRHAPEAQPGSLQRLVRRRMTSKDWDDAADLFEQGSVQAEDASLTTHTPDASSYARDRMQALAMYATRKARMERVGEEVDAAAFNLEKARLKRERKSARKPPNAKLTDAGP